MVYKEIEERFKSLNRGGKYELLTHSDTLTTEKIDVMCKEHGRFSVRLSNLFRGVGCPYCSNKIRKTAEEFKSDAMSVHGNLYSYDKVDYINAKTKVCITCNKHGDFWQTPTNHLNGNGCPKCKKEKLHLCFAMSKDDFIKKAIGIHGDTYDYSKVEYYNNSTNVNVICKKHGVFSITPNNHLKGEGCPICKESSLEREVRNRLIQESIDFTPQWHLYWHPQMSLDFFLPSHNIGIECQGIQHFEENHFFEKLDVVQSRDNVKRQECIDHGIEILYYSHYPSNGCITSIDELLSVIHDKVARKPTIENLD